MLCLVTRGERPAKSVEEIEAGKIKFLKIEICFKVTQTNLSKFLFFH